HALPESVRRSAIQPSVPSEGRLQPRPHPAGPGSVSEGTMKNCQFAIAAFSLSLLLSVSASAEVGAPEVSDSIRNDVSPPVGALVFRAAPARPTAEREAPSIRRPKLEQMVNAAT